MLGELQSLGLSFDYLYRHEASREKLLLFAREKGGKNTPMLVSFLIFFFFFCFSFENNITRLTMDLNEAKKKTWFAFDFIFFFFTLFL